MDHRQFDLGQIQPFDDEVDFGHQAVMRVWNHGNNDNDNDNNDHIIRIPGIDIVTPLDDLKSLAQINTDDIERFRSNLVGVSKQYIYSNIVRICSYLCINNDRIMLKPKCIMLLITTYRHVLTNTQRRQICFKLLSIYMCAYERMKSPDVEKFVYDAIVILATDLTAEFDKLIKDLCDDEINIEYGNVNWFLRNRAIRALYAIIYTKTDHVFAGGFEFYNTNVCIDVNPWLLGKLISEFMRKKIYGEFKLMQILSLVTPARVAAVPAHSIDDAILETYRSSTTLAITRKLVICGYNPRQLIDAMLCDMEVVKKFCIINRYCCIHNRMFNFHNNTDYNND
jgi:hypothetical protein